MGIFVGRVVERWSGKLSLSVDRSLLSPASRSPMESWSSAPTRVDRTRFAPLSKPASQAARTSWSSAQEGEDRTGLASVSVSSSRIAESRSNARKRGDRTRHAIVDIRNPRVATESWSSAQQREDRTQIAVAGNQRRRWVKRAGGGVVAVSAVGLVLLLAAPIALADT